MSDLEGAVDGAVELAERLLATSSSDRAQRRFARLVADESGKRLAIGFADQVLRIRDDGRAAARFRSLLAEHGAPAFAGATDRALLRVGAAASRVAPALVMPLVRRRIRNETSNVIISAHDPELREHIAARRAAGVHLNVNLLGEAILGEEEAANR
ncbi:MAG: RHH-type transcriptional regulator, proline utilization regulon repressor / proline dehydrogenase, partial [Actinomycetota bacterium]|nr:RHH-type transcriptional regulator, proline utilization regulon repressor / proline dehydrogenase [Actinomycetota bacterium]